jgi:DNA polymerase I-like protein with 3'-5' exonuclease and polymerase domains
VKRSPAVTVIDFETDPIQERPEYPPKPVGVSIQRYGEKPRYFAWGHYSGGNNCSKRDAKNALRAVWGKDLLLFHHGKFDVDVAQAHMDCGPLPWERYHDTEYLLFLHDPHAPDFKLKPSSERLLNLPPDELDEMSAWLWEHRQQLRAEFGIEIKRGDGAKWTAYVPGDIAGRYANGDSTRTQGLWKYLWPRIQDRGMGEAYDRERELMPILLDNERVGIRVDLRALRKDIKLFTPASRS